MKYFFFGAISENFIFNHITNQSDKFHVVEDTLRHHLICEGEGCQWCQESELVI